MRTFILLITLAGLTACGNPYRTNFNSVMDKYPPWLEGRMARPGAKPQLIISDDIQDQNWKLVERGYVMVGFSKFDLPSIEPQLALKEGARVGADIVLVQKKFSKSLTETVTVTQWAPIETTDIREDTSVTTAQGTEQINHNVTVTHSRGPETLYLPQQVDYYEHSATYWRKVERPLFGAVVRDLTDEQKQRLETNRGLNVRAIVTDSPAFAADLLKGDIILKVNGQQVSSAQKFYDEIIGQAGKEINLSIVRGSKTIERTVHLNP